MKKLIVLMVVVLVILVMIVPVDAKKKKKKGWKNPFNDLQKQINVIDERLAIVESKKNVEVYDANGQFIGYLHGGTDYPICIPELDACTIFDPYGRISYSGSLYYTGSNCTGEAYWGVEKYRMTKILKLIGTKYLIIDPIQSEVMINSVYIDYKPPECINTTEPVSVPGWHGVEMGEHEFPFNVPITMPLRYE